MKILTINCVNSIYSTGKIIASIEKYTKNLRCEYLHCYEYGKSDNTSRTYLISNPVEYRFNYWISKVSGLQYGSGIFSTIRLCKKIKNYNPDIVHIHCPNARSVNLFYLLDFLKKSKYKTVITNHAEYFYTGNCPHAFDCKEYLYGCIKCQDFRKATGSLFFNRTSKSWKYMKKAFSNFDTLMMVAVSPWAEKRIKQSVIVGNKPTVVIKNGVDTENIFHRCYDEELKREYENKKIILHVTSHFSDDYDDPKGGAYIFEIAKKFTECVIVVIGPVGFLKCKIPQNVIIKGVIEDQNILSKYYSIADLTVMTSKRETFGLTCIESMCCGTPVVGFKNGGTESIALNKYSEFVEYGNVDSLCAAIKENIDIKSYICKELEKEASFTYSEKRMAIEYYNLYKSM